MSWYISVLVMLPVLRCSIFHTSFLKRIFDFVIFFPTKPNSLSLSQWHLRIEGIMVVLSDLFCISHSSLSCKNRDLMIQRESSTRKVWTTWPHPVVYLTQAEWTDFPAMQDDFWTERPVVAEKGSFCALVWYVHKESRELTSWFNLVLLEGMN